LRKSRSRIQSRRSSQNHTQLTHYEEDSRILKQYYLPPPPRRYRREHEHQESTPRKVRVDLPHFHGKEDVEAYLD